MTRFRLESWFYGLDDHDDGEYWVERETEDDSTSIYHQASSDTKREILRIYPRDVETIQVRDGAVHAQNLIH